MYDLVEALHHAEVPVAIAETGCWRQMVTAANDLTAWTNDLLSVSREVAAGESTNYAIVLRRTTGCDIEEAVRQVPPPSCMLRDHDETSAAAPSAPVPRRPTRPRSTLPLVNQICWMFGGYYGNP